MVETKTTEITKFELQSVSFYQENREEQAALIEQAQAGNLKAREAIFLCYKEYIEFSASRYFRSVNNVFPVRYGEEDLKQDMCMCFLNHILPTFNPTKSHFGNHLQVGLSYYLQTYKNEQKPGKNSQAIRLSQILRAYGHTLPAEKLFNLDPETVARKTNEDLTRRELKSRITAKAVTTTLQYGITRHASIDIKEDSAQFFDYLVGGAPARAETNLMVDDISEMVSNLLNSEVLNERERDILILRNGLYNNDKATLRDLAEKYNVSREMIRQIQARAEAKLSKSVKQQGIKGHNFF